MAHAAPLAGFNSDDADSRESIVAIGLASRSPVRQPVEFAADNFTNAIVRPNCIC